MVSAPITVRDATPDDGPFLRKMIWEALMASPTFVALMGEDTVRQHEDRYWERWTQQPEPAFIAIDASGRLLGVLSLRPNASDQPSWRIAIGVEAEVRGQGVGQRLIKRALEFSKSRGATYLNLFVDPVNEAAIALYEKMGFVEVSRRDEAIEMRVKIDL